jgi:hypothetical protein
MLTPVAVIMVDARIIKAKRSDQGTIDLRYGPEIQSGMLFKDATTSSSKPDPPTT